MIKSPGKLFCWNCGRTEGARPDSWYAPFWLQLAHIASGQGRAVRVDDKRAVVLMCSRCHAVHVSDSDRLSSMHIAGEELPTIDERHTLWMKQKFDKENYDIEFLQKIWIGKVPQPEKPPEFWRNEMYKNQGLML